MQKDTEYSEVFKRKRVGSTLLKTVYIGLLRSVLDYGCMVYESASKTVLKKLDVIQYQALRVCCDAKKTTPVSALQVEMGEMPKRADINGILSTFKGT